MAAELHVALVAADREVWSGEATLVVARTTSGDIGVMPGHQPLLGVLESGPVTIRTSDGGTVVAAVHGGFISFAARGGLRGARPQGQRERAETGMNGPRNQCCRQSFRQR